MYNSLLNLSEEGKLQIVSRLIQAIINNSYVETKSLHPIVHRMKLSLLDGAGLLMLVSLDEDKLLAQNVPAGDIPLFKYIIYRLAIELAEEDSANIWISLDQHEDVVVLLSAETYPDASQIAKDFLQKIQNIQFPHMELSLSAGLSSSFEDILMVHDAYLEASEDMPKSQFKKMQRSIPNRQTAAEPDGNLVHKAKQYIHSHFANPISLALIAEEIGVSPNYLSTLFHNEVGESYIKYLTGIRMKNAVNYMKSNPAMKIYEIAERVGYVNVKHFSYVFKQYYSVSPGEYQQKSL